VLASSRHLDCADRDLGMRSGAAAIVSRTPGLDELVAAVREHARIALAARTITRPDLPNTIRRRVITQHENPRPHVSNAARIWKAMPVVLDRVCDPPEIPRDVVQILDEVLAGLLDASGFALGLVYTYDGERFELRSQLGFSPTSQRDINDFFGNADVLRRALDGQNATALDHAGASPTAQDLLARAQVGSMLIAPLIRRGDRIGVIVLASLNPAVPPDWLELARAARWPIAQASVLPGTAASLLDSGPSGFARSPSRCPTASWSPMRPGRSSTPIPPPGGFSDARRRISSGSRSVHTFRSNRTRRSRPSSRCSDPPASASSMSWHSRSQRTKP
jgi:hypothetical protein